MTEHTPNDEALDARLLTLGGALDEGLPEEALAVESLLALRAGDLEDEALADVEQGLVEDDAARAMLYALDEAPGEAMEAWALTQLEQAAEERGEGPQSEEAPAETSAGAREVEPEGAKVIPFPRRWTTWAGGGVIAAAAALLIVLLRPDALAPPDEYTLAAVQGMIQEVRGEEDPHAKRVFDAVSRIKITLHPEKAPEGGVPALQVFVDGPDGLAPVQVDLTERKGAFLIEADAGRIFGDRAGKRFVYVALAQKAEALAELAGGSAAEARENSSLRWVEIPVTYRGEQDP